jgi:proline iminopeptidase
MAYISVYGVDHYYEWITNQGSRDLRNPNKPALVFLHGWGGSARYWQTVAEALTPQFDCLLYDMRGFGRSSLPDPLPDRTDYSLEAYAEDLLVLLDQLNLDRVSLNAHSMGASVAAFFANRYPERVDRAILTCNGLLEYDEFAFKAFHRFSTYVVKFRPKWLRHIPFADRMFMTRFLHRSLPSSDNQAFLEDFLMADYAAALGTAHSAVSKHSADAMPQEYTKLSMPTLLISGEHDRIITAEMGRQAAALNEQVQFKVVADTAHFPMLENPETYMQYVWEFLAG